MITGVVLAGTLFVVSLDMGHLDAPKFGFWIVIEVYKLATRVFGFFFSFWVVSFVFPLLLRKIISFNFFINVGGWLAAVDAQYNGFVKLSIIALHSVPFPIFLRF